MSPKRRTLIRRLAKGVFVTLGVVAILLAVALGVFRLLIGQIPEYQSELKAWVAEELGLVVDFAELDARLGLTGPELSLRAASIGRGERGFLEADRATITLDPVALVLGRRIEIARLTLDGVQLTVERDAAGTLRLGDDALVPVAVGPGAIPQSVEVVIRDSVLRYVDAGRGQSFDFSDLELSIESTDGRLGASASLVPPPGLAGRVELSAVAELPGEASGGAGTWHVEAAVVALDLEGLTGLLPAGLVPPLAGRGDVSAVAEWAGGRLLTATLDVALEAVQIGAADGDAAPYEALGLTAEWRAAPAGFRLELGDVELARNGRVWEPPVTAAFALERDVDGIGAVELSASFIRLDDLEPIVSAFPESQLAEQWELFGPVGEIRDLDFSLERREQSFVYELDAAFDGLAVRQVGPTPGIAGITGRVQAAEDSGTIEFSSRDLGIDWPALFPRVVGAESLTGAVVWRQGRDAVQVLGVDLGVGVLGGTARAGFDLRVPRDGGSPTLDLDADLALVELVPAKRYLPTGIMPEAVVDWLEAAVIGGRGRNIDLELYGTLAEFPFDNGGGQFRVTADIEDATLDYMQGWPLAEALEGRVEFVNAGFAASGAGQTRGNASESIAIAIPDMRLPLLTLSARTEGALADVVGFLREVPLIAANLGPDFERLEVQGGTGAIDAALDLPLDDPGAFTLDASLAIADGAVAIAGFGPAISEIDGTVIADEQTVAARDIDAVFLGGPVVASLSASERPGYRAELAVEGETMAEAVAESFALPHENLLAGQTLWRGRLWLPALDPLATTPTRITLESNLAGVALRFPEPLAKPPSEPSNLRLDLEFAADNRLEVTGNLGATRRFVLSYRTTDHGLEFTRGTVRFGGGEPSPPIPAGLLVNGQIEALSLDDWIELAGDSRLGQAGPLFLGADIGVADFHAFGQQLGQTALRVLRRADDWLIDVESEPIAGQIVVPRGAGSREPVLAEMSRVYLAAAEGGDLAGVDPRQLPGLRLEAGELGIGTRRLGRVVATVAADPRGLRLTEFESETPNYRIGMSGSWLRGSLGTRTTIDAGIVSTDVEAALAELGLDPVIAGESATVTASVYFDAAPGGDWLDHLNGDVSLYVETGTLSEIDPGAGRVVGLMSIAALPRRLTLDFRDVFEEGFAFDEIGGSFRIIDGNAYTNDLKFTGPAAEIGVVGRTGLRDRDYRQQIVVAPEPGNVLPTVAGLLAGPGAGAAIFVFTRLFKEPLKGIGRASYCLQGSWEEPTVERIDNDARDRAASCAELPEVMSAEIGDG